MRYSPLTLRKSDSVKALDFIVQMHSGHTSVIHFQNWLRVSSCVLLLIVTVMCADPGSFQNFHQKVVSAQPYQSLCKERPHKTPSSLAVVV